MAHIRLHVQQADGNLPMVCMRCGEPASVLKTKKLAYYPRGLLLLVILGAPGLLLMVILALALRKTARLQAPLCEQHQNHWLVRTAITWTATILALAVGIGGIVGAITLDNPRLAPQFADVLGPLLCLGSVMVFIGWLILLAVLQNTAIRPDEITRTHVLLNGVSDEFVSAVEDAEIERRVRLRQWELEDEAEALPQRAAEDKPPRRKPATDAIEAERPQRDLPPPDAFQA